MEATPIIEVQDLVRRFGAVTAVDHLSFEMARGEIVGFLGPNGAGKTTTLRILSGFLPASGGRAVVAGRDVFSESIEVRRRIGYLPEQCPLYPEMRVREYLNFRASLKGLSGRRHKRRVATVIEQCGLGDMKRRTLGVLSKGYRQRVGLADALVHEPELLILDEPTIGLDPQQMMDVRGLIRGLASSHSVLISTHILSEVEAVCNRVLIINRGRIAASDTPAALRSRMHGGPRIVAEIQADKESLFTALSTDELLTGARLDQLEGGWVRCVLANDRSSTVDCRPRLASIAAQHEWPLRELRRERRSLEDVFVELIRADREVPA